MRIDNGSGLNSFVLAGGWRPNVMNSSWTVELGDDCEDEVPGFSPAKRYIVETASLVLDFHQYFSDVVCNNQHDNRSPGAKRRSPAGFSEVLMDQMTERECNVGRFICPFGLGPAGETCTCTDPSGVVLTGRTIK